MTMLPPDPLYIFKKDMEPVFCLLFKNTEQNQCVYAGTQTGTVHVWDLKTNREIGKLESSKESCLALYSPHESEEIVTQDKAGIIRFWKEENLNWTLIETIETDYYGFCKFYQHNETLYFPLKKSCVQRISLKTKTKTDIINFLGKNEINEIMSFKVIDINNETVIFIAYESCDIKLWNVKESKMLNGIKTDECPMALEFDPVNMKGVCGSPTEKLLIFVVSRNFEIVVKKNIILKNPGVASLAIRPDGKLLAVGCWDGKLRLYSMKSLSILAVLDTHTSTVQDVVFGNFQSENEKPKYLLAAASKDCKVSLWDLYNY